MSVHSTASNNTSGANADKTPKSFDPFELSWTYGTTQKCLSKSPCECDSPSNPHIVKWKIKTIMLSI